MFTASYWAFVDLSTDNPGRLKLDTEHDYNVRYILLVEAR